MAERRKYPPTMAEWKRFIVSRTGLLPIDEGKNIQVLCLACGVPIDLSGGVMVRVGCIVSMSKIEEVIVDGKTFEEMKRIYLPISTKGYGCLECHYKMARLHGEVSIFNRNNEKQRTAWIEVDPRGIEMRTTVAGYDRGKK